MIKVPEECEHIYNDFILTFKLASEKGYTVKEIYWYHFFQRCLIFSWMKVSALDRKNNSVVKLSEFLKLYTRINPDCVDSPIGYFFKRKSIFNKLLHKYYFIKAEVECGSVDELALHLFKEMSSEIQNPFLCTKTITAVVSSVFYLHSEFFKVNPLYPSLIEDIDVVL